MKIAVVGASGLVGREMLRVLEEMQFPVSELLPVASSRSVNQMLPFCGQAHAIIGMEAAIAAKPDIALFSAGGTVSQEWAPRFAEAGITVIDNSSAWRMDPNVPLVVPEINPDTIGQAKIIANPNCSTIQMVVALHPLHQAFGIRRLVISTYQSVTGTGKDAVEQLMGERNGTEVKAVYPQVIDLNCLPHCDVFLDNGYTKEEMKLVHETRKILRDPEIRITATAVRVPVIGGHSETVNVEFNQRVDARQIREILAQAPGVVLMDNPTEKIYPTPRIAHGRNEVFVGRIRNDESCDHAVNLWIVADNLRKGAATNAVQIAFEVARSRNLIPAT